MGSDSANRTRSVIEGEWAMQQETDGRVGEADVVERRGVGRRARGRRRLGAATASFDGGALAYDRVLAATQPAWWRGVLAIVLLIAVWLAVTDVLFRVMGLIPEDLPADTADALVDILSVLQLAALAPIAMMVHRLVFGVPARTLFSLRSTFRLGLVWRSLLLIAPVLLIVQAVDVFQMPAVTPVERSSTAQIVFACFILVCVPLQAAGEEFAFRGLLLRIMSGWGRGPVSGAVVGIVLSSLVFSAYHGWSGPLVFVDHVVFGLATGYIVWRTGGIEIAIVLHAVNNVTLGLPELVAGIPREALGVDPSWQTVWFLVAPAAAVVVHLATRRTGTLRVPVGDVLPLVRTGSPDAR